MKRPCMVGTSDISDDDLVASVVETENAVQHGTVSPFSTFEKMPLSSKNKVKIMEELMFNQPKTDKEMDEYGKKR